MKCRFTVLLNRNRVGFLGPSHILVHLRTWRCVPYILERRCRWGSQGGAAGRAQSQACLPTSGYRCSPGCPRWVAAWPVSFPPHISVSLLFIRSRVTLNSAPQQARSHLEVPWKDTLSQIEWTVLLLWPPQMYGSCPSYGPSSTWQEGAPVLVSPS